MEQIAWRSPSNLALVKYWGKYGQQLPSNPSISFTLDAAYTDTTLKYAPKTDNGEITLSFWFEGEEKPDFARRIERFLSTLQAQEMPFLSAFHFEIHSSNSFPHSSGIASSASSMSALALCLCDMERKLGHGAASESAFLQRASHIARLGSGSASRSVFPYLATWGESETFAGSSNTFALPSYEGLPELFTTFHDTILIVSASEKKVSSSAGHKLMENHPFAAVRFQQAHRNLALLWDAMRQGDLTTFGRIVEEEALTLHGLMMNSNPAYMLLQPNTVAGIHRLWAWREKTKLPLYFSLDAGPNLHLLYPDAIAAEAQAFIEEELVPLCDAKRFLNDRVGKGPHRL